MTFRRNSAISKNQQHMQTGPELVKLHSTRSRWYRTSTQVARNCKGQVTRQPWHFEEARPYTKHHPSTAFNFNKRSTRSRWYRTPTQAADQNNPNIVALIQSLSFPKLLSVGELDVVEFLHTQQNHHSNLHFKVCILVQLNFLPAHSH